jgi:hypothetical protein
MNRSRAADRLAVEAGISVSTARLVLETAREVIAAEHPHLVDKVDALLADETRATRAVRWIARLAAGARPDDGTTVSNPASEQDT